MKTYTIPQYGITVTITDSGVGRIESKLKEQLFGDIKMAFFHDSVAEEQAEVLESFILALACEGYDVSEPRFVKALQSSLEAIGNQP